MAVRPQELIQDIEKEADILERIIDLELKKVKVYHENGVVVNTPKDFKIYHLPAIKERYIKAGWKDVIYKDDQRDGSWLEFKIR